MVFQKYFSLSVLLLLVTIIHAQPWDGTTSNSSGAIYRSGNVGIGTTTNPTSPLSVNGDGNIRWTSYIHSDGNINGATALRVEVDKPVGFTDQVSGIRSVIEAGTSFAYGIYGKAFTETPASSGRAYGVYAIAGNATPGANYGVYARLEGSNGGAAIFGSDDVNFGDPGSPQNLLGDQTWAGYFVGNTQVTNALGIACTNMSQPIGGGNQIYRLFVNGGIASKALIIQNNGNWCDYVFEEDYELKTLSEVAQHIEENGHLHNTPSATEIKEIGGFEVGDITLNQQEKIEEIFLHLIKMDQEIKALKAENATLKTALETQK